MYQTIVYAADPFLQISVDRANPKAPVWFRYGDADHYSDDLQLERETKFLSGDLPADDQAAAKMVAESLG
ncbi:hypothetical protein OPU71_02550 [Niveibacterium sp. 24ML]|uniref:hypothetical protein n=1 Tax=Niveibacterium sp. 24ML TaxID=2985512 RepID=UPI00226F2921|nr:hypothetical protein [Niveibacterium sp. 24ML]MCX9155001.1 hypothetical protein [Niveibacterium sp. 24ML]